MKAHNPKIADTGCRATLIIEPKTDLSLPLAMADGLPLYNVDNQSWQALKKAAAVVIRGLDKPIHAKYLYCYKTKSFIKQ